MIYFNILPQMFPFSPRRHTVNLRAAFVIGFSLAVVASSAISAKADFSYIRSIPAPHISGKPDCITGLDHTGSSLVVASAYSIPDSNQGISEAGSSVFRIDPATGDVYEQGDFEGSPPCESGFWQICACAFGQGEVGIYWAADQCGQIVQFSWSEGLNIYDNFGLSPEAPNPISMAASGETLFVLNSELNQIIARYHSGDSLRIDTIPLEGSEGQPIALTIWRDHFLVAANPLLLAVRPATESQFLLWEYARDGHLVATHSVTGPEGCWPANITCLDDTLYVAGTDCEYIYVFAPAVYNADVPPGDSVVVEAIPGKVEIAFDSVSTGGTLEGAAAGSDSCPPPEGVTLMPDYYHLTTTAHFDYAAEVDLSRTEALPPGVELKYVRVFVRPSGECAGYRDITTAGPAEVQRTLMSLTRTKSEDDEFSVFALGEDRRQPKQVVELKLDGLGGTIEGGQDTIPGDVLTRVRGLLDMARDAYYRGCSHLAAERADSISALVRATPAIPHTYDPEVQGRNLAGRLISDSHTLAFSLRFSASEAFLTRGILLPVPTSPGHDGLVRACIEVPAGLDPNQIDPEHVFFMHTVRAIPDSVGPADCDGDGNLEIRAVFSASGVRSARGDDPTGAKMITCFVEGEEVHADVGQISTFLGMMEEGPYSAGRTERVTWEDSPCGSGTSVSLWFSPDAGTNWELVARDLGRPYFDWPVPPVETRHGLLKVTCTSAGGVPAEVPSQEFTITSSSGVDGTPGKTEPRLAVSPNPSPSSFAVELTTEVGRPVEVRIFSIKGELVKTLFDGWASTGTLSLNWHGDSDSGKPVAPGAYFVVARTGGRVLARKVIMRS
jgi:hypothetical protein